MIDRVSPLVMALAVALISGLALLASRRPSHAAQAPISGQLITEPPQEQHDHKIDAPVPTIDLGVDPSLRTAFPVSTQVLVRFVPVEASTVTIVAASMWREASRMAARAARDAETQRRALSMKRIAAPVATAAPAPAPAVATALPPAPPPLIEPTLPRTFSEIDEALRAASTTQTIDKRVKDHGVSFRLTHVGRVRDRYVVRYAIANEEPADFFMSIVNVTAGGKPIHAETAGPYACQTNQEIVGVVHFAPVDVKGRSVVLELVQSGGEHRRFALTVPYSF